jgi:hypothetical protein
MHKNSNSKKSSSSFVDFYNFFFKKLELEKKKSRNLTKRIREAFWWWQIEELIARLNRSQLKEFFDFAQSHQSQPEKIFKKLFSFFSQREINRMIEQNNLKMISSFWQVLIDSVENVRTKRAESRS